MKADKFIDEDDVFPAKSVIEFVADRAKEARHRGALSVASELWAYWIKKWDTKVTTGREQQSRTGAKQVPDWVLLISGLVLILIPVALAILVPGALPLANVYLRIIAALGAALVGAFIPGALQVNFPGVKAAGAIALFVVTFLANPPEKAAQALQSGDGKMVKVCMGNGGGDNCLTGAAGHFDCDAYSKMGGGSQQTYDNLSTMFCGSKQNTARVTVTQNNGGGQCGWTAFQVVCNNSN